MEKELKIWEKINSKQCRGDIFYQYNNKIYMYNTNKNIKKIQDRWRIVCHNVNSKKWIEYNKECQTIMIE